MYSLTINDINERNHRLNSTNTYENTIGLIKLITALECGVKKENLCQYLNVSEAELKHALRYYKLKYGDYYNIDTYTIVFEPLGIMKAFY